MITTCQHGRKNDCEICAALKANAPAFGALKIMKKSFGQHFETPCTEGGIKHRTGCPHDDDAFFDAADRAYDRATGN